MVFVATIILLLKISVRVCTHIVADKLTQNQEKCYLWHTLHLLAFLKKVLSQAEDNRAQK